MSKCYQLNMDVNNVNEIMYDKIIWLGDLTIPTIFSINIELYSITCSSFAFSRQVSSSCLMQSSSGQLHS